jgi:hypothetical protein
MVPFHAWTLTVDQKDDHLVLARGADGTYDVACVDFQHSFQWPQGDGGPVQAPSVPACMANCIDKSVVATTVAAIEGMTDSQIRNAVTALETTEDEKKRLADGLIGRRGKIREIMRSQKWLN